MATAPHKPVEPNLFRFRYKPRGVRREPFFLSLTNTVIIHLFLLQKYTPSYSGERWFLKTLLSNYCSFKLDIPEEDAATIPEMHHKYIAWNMYLVPSAFAKAPAKNIPPQR